MEYKQTHIAKTSQWSRSKWFLTLQTHGSGTGDTPGKLHNPLLAMVWYDKEYSDFTEKEYPSGP